MSKYQEIAQILSVSQKIAIAGHVSPDGDCIGSALALGLALRQMGKQVTWYTEDNIPAVYHFLPGATDYLTPEGEVNPEVMVLVDCSDLGRLSPGIAAMAKDCQTIINIDHHISNTGFGHHQLVDAQAAATGEIIYQVIKELPVKLDQQIATNIYTAIVTDTGNFKYENTTATTHQIVAELLSLGISPALIAKQIYDEMPYTYIQVLKVGLNNLQLSADGKVAWIALGRDELAKVGASDEHTDGLINYARLIKGVEVAMVLREADADFVKVSFRSKNHVDVNKLAAAFNGGGHKKASGCKLNLPLPKATELVVEAAKLAVAEVDH